MISPVPLHSGQVVGFPTIPLPLHVEQTSCRVTLNRKTVPLIACQNATVTWYSRSLPGSGPCGSRAPPLKIEEKISRKPPDRFCPPAPLVKSEKSKPLKSNGTSCVRPCAPAPPGNPPNPPAPKPAPPPRAYASAA